MVLYYFYSVENDYGPLRCQWKAENMQRDRNIEGKVIKQLKEIAQKEPIDLTI